MSLPATTPNAPARTHPDAIAPPETITVSGHRVACEGDGGVLGHPRIYLELGDKPFVECPYCDRRFVPEHHDH